MRTADEQELAFSMLRLWGDAAAQRAREYALRQGPGSGKWHRIERLIAQLRAEPSQRFLEAAE